MRFPAVLLLSAAALAADSKATIRPEALLEHVRFLAADELQGRGNGTEGLERAAEYIAAELASAGLRPGGNNGTWFQPFDLVTGLTVGEGNRLSIRANGRSVSFVLGETYFPLSATAGESTREPSARIPDADLVFAGYGIYAPALDYDDYAGLDVSGKAVLVFTHEPQEHDEKSRFAGRSSTNFASLLSKAMTARNRGARLLLVVSDPTHDADGAPYEGFARDPQADDYGIPVLRIHRDRLEPLLAVWDLDAAAREIDASGAPRSRPLTGATADYVEHMAKAKRTVRNVIGILPGSDPALTGQAVVIGAHYDHLGLGGRHSMSPRLAGQVHNGADDNASGTAALIEIARAAAASRSRFARTMVFAAFAGEELGLVGSAYYVNHPPVPLDDTVAMLNLDMVGRPRGRILLSGLETAPSVARDVESAAEAVEGLEIRPFQEGAGVGASDDTSFALERIPAIGFFSGFHSDYHRPTDDWQEIDGEGAAGVATLAYELAARLAARPDRPEFVVKTAPAHGAAPGGDAGSIGSYGPYFGSVPDFADAGGGVRFAEIRGNSPAARAGLKAGDVLVEFGGKLIRTLYDFTFALRERKPGDKVEVTVMRDGRPLTVTVALATRR